MYKFMFHINKLQGLVRANIWSVTKFAAVGTSTSFIYFIVMWLALNVVGFNYVLAVSMAYFVSTLFHYLTNRNFTFTAQGGQHTTQLARYMGMWTTNYFITMGVVSFFVERLGQSAYVGVCCALVITVFISYFLSRYWVFKIKGVGL